MFYSKTFAGAAAVLAILALATLAASRGQTTNNSSSAEAQKAVLARLTEIQNAAQALDPDKVFSFVMENDKGALVQNGRILMTKKDGLESTRQGFQRLQKVEYHFDQEHITVLSPSIALAIGAGSSSATGMDGRIITTQFAQTVLFVLTNGDWQVFHSHRSSVTPP